MLYGREALFHALQQDDFSAITRLKGLAQADGGRRTSTAGAPLLARLEMDYGVPDLAAADMNRLARGGAPAQDLDPLWVALARYRYDRGETERAGQALSHVSADPAPSRVGAYYRLRVRMLSDHGEFDRAAEVADRLPAGSADRLYSSYNLAVALDRGTGAARGRARLRALAAGPAEGDEARALRDKVNTALGDRALDDKAYGDAAAYFGRVDGDGPYGAAALLGLGRAYAGLGQAQRALACWQRLGTLSPAAAPVQAALILSPASLRDAGRYGAALAGFQKAVTTYATEINAIDAVGKAIRSTPFDELAGRAPGAHDGEALFKALRSPYLQTVFTDARFQRAYADYVDMRHLSRRLDRQAGAMGVFGRALADDKRRYLRLSRALLERYRQADMDGVTRKVRAYRRELADVEKSKDALKLITDDEAALLRKLQRTDKAIVRVMPYMVRFDSVLQRFRLMRGLKIWQIINEFDARLKTLKRALADVERQQAALSGRVAALREERRRALARIDNRVTRLHALKSRIAAMRPRVDALLYADAAYLKDRMLTELARRRAQLQGRMAEAHFAIAQLNDRFSGQVAAQ